MRQYAARRVPEQLGPAAWNSILGKQAAPKSLQGELKADFVVVGAGFAGLSCARRLTQLAPGAQIVVLEAGRIAEGAAGRNSGFMIDLPHDLASNDYSGDGDDRAMIALNRQAIAFARDAVAEYGIAGDFFDPTGKINGAASEAAHSNNENYARHLESLGEAWEFLDSRQMHELSGSRHYQSGLYTPGTVMLQPAGYVRGMAAGLGQAGVSIHENSPATRFHREGTGWIVATPAGRVRTDRVMLTVNGHLESFGFEPGRLMHLFLYASMTNELDAEALRALGGAPRWGITPSDPMGTTMRRIDAALGGNRIVTRTCATLQPGMKPSRAGLSRAARVMRRKFDQRFPALAGTKMEFQWAGHLCLSRNGVAVMREVEDGVFAGCVQNGLGTARGTLTGVGAAELACGETSEITQHFTAQPRPQRLPPRLAQKVGANAILRLKEWRARTE